MKQYHYKSINIFTLKQKAAETGIPTEITQFQVMNQEGNNGWRCLNPQDGMTLYFEKEFELA